MTNKTNYVIVIDMTGEEFDRMVEEHERYISDLSNIISFEEFNRVVKRNSELLDFLGDSAHRSPIINIIDNNTYNLTSDFLLSASKTLKSISTCCRLGNFADVNMLIRKYTDDIFLYLYIIETSNNQKWLTDENVNEIIGGEMTEEKLIKLISSTFFIQSSRLRKDEQGSAVDAWFNNTAENGEFYRYLDINNYLRYLKKNKLVKICIEKHRLENIWRELGRKQNNYTHNNGRNFLTDNIIYFDNSKKGEFLLEDVYKDITFIT